MAIRGDIGAFERDYLLDMLPRRLGRVLEIGCGDGRLTRKYADEAGRVIGIDLPGAISGRAAWMRAAGASATSLPLPAGQFDCAIFALSL